MAQREATLTAEAAPPPRHERIAIQDASSWILRVGVIVSVAVMLTGLALAFVQDGSGLTVHRMENSAFSLDLQQLDRGLAHGDAFALMELGVLLLVLTPILRVLTAMVLFALEERDRLYTVVTCLVLVMTLGSLVFIK
jgi:uncharacterized membrane protein